MSFRVLEVTVISGENLCVSRKQPVKKNAFVIIRTEGQIEKTQQMTKMDKDGGSYPAWGEKFLMDMPMHAHYFTAEVRCKTSTGDKLIGTARVPASDFLGGLVPESYLHFLSYRLWDARGQRNGIINLSVRVKSSPADVGYGGGSCSRSRQSWSGFPVISDSKVSNGETVTGIPVW